MASVTVTGPGGSEGTISIPIGSPQNDALAQQLLNDLSEQILSGGITPYTYDGTGPLTPPPGESAMQYTGKGVVSVPADTSFVLVPGDPTVFGGQAPKQVVISGLGPLTYYANAGIGTVIAGAGNNFIKIGKLSSDHLVLTDSGNDTIKALYGNDSIGAGLGHNLITLGVGNDSVDVTGHDKIYAGSGFDTVTVEKRGDAVITGDSGKLLVFIDQGGQATVFGGQGSVTVDGAAGRSEYLRGGWAGHNSLVGGANTSLFGAGSGDTLIATGGNSLLVAGKGNETLIGSSGSDTFRAGSGNDLIKAGKGSDTIFAGTGNETAWGGGGSDAFVFKHGQAGGHAEIKDFTVGRDKVVFQGYGRNELQYALRHATVSGGSLTLTLSDRTTITFDNVDKLNKSSFNTDGKG